MMVFSDSNHCSASLRARIEGGEFVRLPTVVHDENADRNTQLDSRTTLNKAENEFFNALHRPNSTIDDFSGNNSSDISIE